MARRKKKKKKKTLVDKTLHEKIKIKNTPPISRKELKRYKRVISSLSINGNKTMVNTVLHCKNILWIPKRHSEAVSLRRTSYAISRRKGHI